MPQNQTGYEVPKPDLSGYEILAMTCHNEHCPTLVRDPANDRIGIVGSVSADPGERREHISWMSRAEWDMLRAGA